MLRSIALMLIVGTCASCMEMRETVERMVVVRTTGSDLQPAATGYIYKKKNDGEESVIEMGQSEVMKHLTKFYEQPNTYKVPIPKHARYVDYANTRETKKDERVIPVKENEDNIDGIAHDDYRKSFDEYMSNYGDSRAYDDYLKGLEHFKGKFNHNDGDSEEDENKYKGYHYGKQDGGNYQNQKYESYSFSGKGGHKNGHGEEDSHKKYYDSTLKHEEFNHGDRDAKTNEDNSKVLHKVYDSEENKKGYDHVDGKGIQGDHHKFGDEHYGAEKGYGHNGSHESEHVSEKLNSDSHNGAESDEKQGEKDSAEGEQSSHEYHSDFGSKNGPSVGKSYGFKIKH